MKKLVLSLVAALSVAAVVVAPASAAYTSPKLTISQGNAPTTTGPARTTIAVSTSRTDDATARVVIYAPPGTVTLNQAAGTTLGDVKAQVVALALGGAVLPLTGSVQVRAADATYLLNGQQVPIARTSQVCTGVATHTAFWVLVLSAAGQTLEVPAFLDTTTGTAEGAFSSAKLTVCLPPPDIPVEKGGAAFGAKLIDAQFSVSGVFQPTTGVWFGLLTPYQAGNGQSNPAGTVYTPAAVAFASITIRLGKTPTAKRITGRLTQGGAGVPNQRVEIWGAVNRAAFRRIAVVRTKVNGTYVLVTRNRANTFQARSTALARPAAQVCRIQSPFPVPCVNPTVTGFSVRSATARA